MGLFFLDVIINRIAEGSFPHYVSQNKTVLYPTRPNKITVKVFPVLK